MPNQERRGLRTSPFPEVTVPAPEVTVLVVTYRGREFLADCLQSIAAQTVPHRLIVIDNASDDGTADLLAAEFPQVEVYRQAANLGFAGALAVGLPLVATRWCALLNDDAVAAPDWLQALLAAVRTDPAVAAATSLMLLSGDPGDKAADPTINNLGVALTPDGYGFDIGLGRPRTAGFSAPTEVFGFSGGAALLDVDAVRGVGGAPAEFFLYYEDTDIAWRLRLAGRRVISVPTAVVHHRHSATIGQLGPVFHLHNERNRLLMLFRCAPLSFAVGQLVRFVITTASLAATRLVGRPVPPALNLQPGFRLRILAGLVRMLPGALLARRRFDVRRRVGRAEVADCWLGNDPLPRG